MNQLPDAPAAGSEPTGGLPSPLRNAVRLMYLGAALQVIAGVVLFFVVSRLRDSESVRDAFGEAAREAGRPESEAQDLIDNSVSAWRTGIVVGTFVLTALWVTMARFNARGKLWARTTATALGALAVASSIFTLFGSINPGAIIGIVIVGAIIYLLYRPESTAYYAAQG